MPRKKETFSQLSIPKASLTEDGEDYYLVYKNSEEFIKIKSDTAFSAIALSGIENPYKVIHHINNTNIILQEGALSKNGLQDLQNKN